jgi:hypothetical protein
MITYSGKFIATSVTMRPGEIVGLGGLQQRPGLAEKQVVGPFDLHDVRVLGDRPKRSVRRNVDQADRCVGAQVRQCGSATNVSDGVGHGNPGWPSLPL